MTDKYITILKSEEDKVGYSFIYIKKKWEA